MLLDFASEIVLPAFLDPQLKRKYGSTRYFFFDARISIIPHPADSTRLLVVHGQFVKDTVLTREQVFSSDEGLVPAEDYMPSAPSAFFALILNNHKLVYLPETAHAPGFGALQATLQRFISLKYEEYIRALHQQSKATEEPKLKGQLYQEIPHPEVKIVPLASRGSIEQFLSAFAKVTHVEFKILDTNAEYSMQGTFRKISEMKRSLRAKTTKLTHDNPAGLDMGHAIEQIHASTATGNQTARIIGTSNDGSKLSGDNEKFKLSVQLEDVPEDPVQRTIRLVHLYSAPASTRSIPLATWSAYADAKVRRLREKIGDVLNKTFLIWMTFSKKEASGAFISKARASTRTASIGTLLLLLSSSSAHSQALVS